MGRSQSGLSHDRRVELVVVALPAEDDQVRKYSSEKEPHLTLLYLGENKYDPAELAHVIDYLDHAASMVSPFMLEVDRRGELGDKHADVLFFHKRYAKEINEFRGYLLQDELINLAYRSVEQFPQWSPHLTMGFPETPAKKDDREYNRFSYVRFDRISLWTEDSSGPTFQLKSEYDNMEVAMSEFDTGQQVVDDLLHYGVKGMKWGKRRADIKAARSPEAVATKATRDKAKKTKVSSLTNKELQDAINRMNLEKQFNTLNPKRLEQGQKVVKSLLGVGNTANQVLAFNNSPAGQQIRESFKNKT